MTLEEFGKTIKQKYPAYANYSDETIGKAMVEKYPVYANRITEIAKPSLGYNSVGDMHKDISSSPLSFLSKAKDWINNTMFNVTSGVAKGVGSTAMGTAELGNTIGNAATSAFGGAPTKLAGQEKINKFLTPEGAAQQIGFGAEKLAEFLAPAGLVKKGELGINAAIKGSGFLPAAERVGAKALLEGATAGGIGAAQSGSFEEGAKIGATVGALKGATATVGEIAKAYGVPEWLMGKYFKTTPDEQKALFAATANGEKSKTLAKSMLDKGAQGTWKELGVNAVKETKNNEAAVQRLVNGTTNKATVPLAELGTNELRDTFNTMVAAGMSKEKALSELVSPQVIAAVKKGAIDPIVVEKVGNSYNIVDGMHRALAAEVLGKKSISAVGDGLLHYVEVNPKLATVLKDVAKEYTDVGSGEVAQEAARLAAKAQTGSLSAPDALLARRLTDRLRNPRSFAPSTKLSVSQQNLKYWSDVLRDSLAKQIEGFGKVMSDYSTNIRALDLIAKGSAKASNQGAVSNMDSLIEVFSILGGHPELGAATIAGKKALLNPAIGTGAAQAIQKGVSTVPGIVVKSVAAKAVTSKNEYQSQ